jgi:hypothetical protein
MHSLPYQVQISLSSISGANAILKGNLALTHAVFIQGMCRGEALDVFPEDAFQPESSGPAPTSADNLWEFLTASDRLAFAPKNEMMSDDEEACLAWLLAVAAAAFAYFLLCNVIKSRRGVRYNESFLSKIEA